MKNSDTIEVNYGSPKRAKDSESANARFASQILNKASGYHYGSAKNAKNLNAAKQFRTLASTPSYATDVIAKDPSMMDFRGSQDYNRNASRDRHEFYPSNSQLSIKISGKETITPMRKRPSLNPEDNFISKQMMPGAIDHRLPLVSQSDVKFPLYRKTQK